jgi:hypothetical protein
MPRGYRLLIISAGGIAVLSALGTGAYFGALYATYNSHKAEKRSESTPGTKQGNPSQIDRDRPGLPNFAETIASAPDPQNSNERENRDLAAQEASALWSFWMLVATGFSALITMIGTGFLLWQIMLTREAVQDTGRATDAMREANEIARDAKERQLRAYICLDTAEVINIFPNIEDYTVTLNVYNSGATPAHDFNFVYGWRFGQIEPTDDFANKFLKEHRSTGFNTVFGPNRKVKIPISIRIPSEFATKIANGSGIFWFFGEIHYQDVFGGDRVTQFSYAYSTVLPNRLAQTDCFNRVT